MPFVSGHYAPMDRSHFSLTFSGAPSIQDRPAMNPDCLVTPQDVLAEELVDDENYALSWQQARSMGLACGRHPATDEHEIDCGNNCCLICHFYREAKTARLTHRLRWVWTDDETVMYLNTAIDMFLKFTKQEPLWLASQGTSPQEVKRNMPRTLQLLGWIRQLNVRAWKDLSHMSMALWPAGSLREQRLARYAGVKVGIRPGEIDEESMYCFMVGQDPGIEFYETLFNAVSPTCLNREKTADILEGLLGMYHGLKRLKEERRLAITRHIGNIYHLAGLWLHYVNAAMERWHDPDFQTILRNAPHGLPDQWFSPLPIYHGLDNYVSVRPDGAI